ncbi:hypothetical protein ACP3T3_15400 [Chryseobacterium sp. CBSDS_008]|uniref:hypothetical protein n=1 Tax=Chryseobacterium sp. CBSDS_008 TaxID=3415265 RepID=UPI003CF3653D
MNRGIINVVVVAIFFICTYGSTYPAQQNESSFLKVKRIATNDYIKKKMKYYHFGTLPLSERNKALLTKNNIQIINKNCIAIPELMYYNKIILEKTHIKL